MISMRPESRSPEPIKCNFGETLSSPTARRYLKWSSMDRQGMPQFCKQNRAAFLRRLKRGAPQEFRWKAWLEAAGAAKILKQKVAGDAAVELLPLTLRPGYIPAIPAAPVSVSVSVDVSNNIAELYRLSAHEFYLSIYQRESTFSSLISIDLSRTFPEVPKLFGADAQARLRRILNAYAVFSPQIGYCQGMNFIAGLLVIVSENSVAESEIFWLFACIMGRYGLQGFFSDGFPLLASFTSAYDALAEFYVPDVHSHFRTEGVLPPVYLHQWLLTLFVTNLPLGTVVVLWDWILAEGLKSVLRISVALLRVLQSFLMRLRFEDIVKFLKTLKQAGECDEGQIGHMILKQAEKYPIPDFIATLVSDADWTPPERQDRGEEDEEEEEEEEGGGEGQGLVEGLVEGLVQGQGLEEEKEVPRPDGELEEPEQAQAQAQGGGDALGLPAT